MSRPPDERTPSGAPLYEHGPGRQGRRARARGPREPLLAHAARHLGPGARLLPDPAPELVHLDLIHVPPAADRNYHALLTAGMSDRPMRPPAEAAGARRAELFLGLPPDWPLDPVALREPQHAWPLELLRWLGRFPHRHATWLAWGHTVPHGDPPRPYAAGTELLCAYLREPRLLEGEAASFEPEPGLRAPLLAVVPIDARELALKLERGAVALELALRKADVTELLDPERPSALD